MEEELSYKIVNYLNELLKLDYQAVFALIKCRVPCNEALINHPTVQVVEDSDGNSVFGLLGILNGLCEQTTIATVFNDTNKLLYFCVLTESDTCT